MQIHFRRKTNSITCMSFDLTFSSPYMKFSSATDKKNSTMNPKMNKNIILLHLVSKLGNQWNLPQFQSTNSLAPRKAGRE